MRITIIKSDGVIGIDGRFTDVDLSSLPDNLRVVQWDGVHGHEEWVDKDNSDLTSISEYQSVVNLAISYLEEADFLSSGGKFDTLVNGVWVFDKGKKLEADLLAIDEEVKNADGLPFEYNGHTYYPDTEFIQGIFSVLPLMPSNYTETWKTAEKEADGISNVYVQLDKAGITGLALAYLQFKKGNWAAGEMQKQALKDAFLQEA